jgi:hypothetical protein
MIGTLTFTTGEDNDLEHTAQEQEEWRMTTIDFELPPGTRGLKNSVTMFQQPTTTNMIDNLARLLIGTPSTTIQSSELALGEIQTMKPKESA